MDLIFKTQKGISVTHYLICPYFFIMASKKKKKAKDPAFLFYPNDWIGGTMGMTFEEKGAYMELLMMQFNRGHMTSHMIGQTVGQLWDKVKDKFVQDDNGLFYNERLEEEKEKRKSYTESRLNNRKGKNQHTKKEETYVGHMTSHMENVNENVIENINDTSSLNILKPNFKKIDFELTDLEVGKADEYLAYTVRVRLPKDEILEKWKAFSILNENELYHDKSKILTHFYNWLKNQYATTQRTNKPNKTEKWMAGRDEPNGDF